MHTFIVVLRMLVVLLMHANDINVLPRRCRCQADAGFFSVAQKLECCGSGVRTEGLSFNANGVYLISSRHTEKIGRGSNMREMKLSEPGSSLSCIETCIELG